VSNVFFVGCGPGDPELITVKAKKLIQKADVVVYSGSLIPDPILKLCKRGKIYDAAKLVREEIFDLLYKNAKKDKLVVRLHDGDPAIYGAIREQIDNLEKKGAESRTKVPKREQISELAKHQATLIFYLSVHLLTKITKEAIEGGYKKTTPVAVVYRASRKDQKIILGTLTDITNKVKAEKITMTAIVIIGDVIKPKSYEYSKLYDKTFSHGFRKAKVK
jgi:precorrin-4/cobalt-precorrin-4 C11-methyltransferase